MITNTGSIASLMDELSSKVGSDQDLYLIGGGAMMFMGSKAATRMWILSSGESPHTRQCAQRSWIWDSNPYVPGRNMPG